MATFYLIFEFSKEHSEDHGWNKHTHRAYVYKMLNAVIAKRKVK